MKSMVTAELVWFVIGIVVLFFELASPGFIIFFFGLGAWITALACFLFDISLNTQLVLFLLSSLALLVSLRKWVKRIFTGKVSTQPDMELQDDFTGLKAVVIRRIETDMHGKVQFQGTDWEAESDEHIEENATVVIVKRNNLVLKVKKV